MRFLLGLCLLTVMTWGWLALAVQPKAYNHPILYQIDTEPQSLILQADGLVSHEN